MSDDEFVLEVDDLDPTPKENAVDIKIDSPPSNDSPVSEKPAASENKPEVKKSDEDGSFGFEDSEKEVEPCQNFRLDISAGFGMCKCGHKKAEHGNRKENKAAELLSKLKAKNSMVNEDVEDYVGGDGPCGKFRLDMNSTAFGMCKCGYNRGDHVEKGANKAKQALERLKSSNLDKYKEVMTGEGPCGNYKVNISADEFGVCHCGYKKEDHVQKEENVASKLLKNLKAKNKEKNDKADAVAQGLVEEEVPEETEVVEELEQKEQEVEEETGKKKKKKKDGKKGTTCVVC